MANPLSRLAFRFSAAAASAPRKKDLTQESQEALKAQALRMPIIGPFTTQFDKAST
jgi:hypothetical protein